MTQRHHCGRYSRVVWTGFERAPLVLCGPCDRKARTTNQLRRERAEREQYEYLYRGIAGARLAAAE